MNFVFHIGIEDIIGLVIAAIFLLYWVVLIGRYLIRQKIMDRRNKRLKEKEAKENGPDKGTS